ncbi:MAG: hypothetical protein F4074_03280, partial [Synechococcus sp. SB0672_bin_10]|nr:hypothetical protein [Synechococcus sp. SB0672_bin_10]
MRSRSPAFRNRRVTPRLMVLDPHLPMAAIPIPQSAPSAINVDHDGRTGSVERVTRETQVRLHLNLDGTGCGQVETTIPFLDHMLMQLVS